MGGWLTYSRIAMAWMRIPGGRHTMLWCDMVWSCMVIAFQGDPTSWELSKGTTSRRIEETYRYN